MLTALTIIFTIMQLFLPSWLGIVVLLLQVILPDAIPTMDEAVSVSIWLVRTIRAMTRNNRVTGENWND